MDFTRLVGRHTWSMPKHYIQLIEYLHFDAGYIRGSPETKILHSQFHDGLHNLVAAKGMPVQIVIISPVTGKSLLFEFKRYGHISTLFTIEGFIYTPREPHDVPNLFYIIKASRPFLKSKYGALLLTNPLSPTKSYADNRVYDNDSNRNNRSLL